MGRGTGTLARVMADNTQLLRAGEFAQWPDIRFEDENARFFGQDPGTALLAHSSPTTKPSWWQQQWAGYQDEATGYSLAVPQRLPWHGMEENPRYAFDKRLSIYMDILDREGNPFGYLIMSVSLDPQKEPEIRLGSMELRRGVNSHVDEDNYSHLGHGFGQRFIDELIVRAQAAGAKRISCNATGIGAYAWARMGFDIDPRGRGASGASSLTSLAQSMNNKVIRARDNGLSITEENHARWQAELDAVLADPQATPLSLATTGQWQQVPSELPGGPPKVSLGRWALLATPWNAYKDISSPVQSAA